MVRRPRLSLVRFVTSCLALMVLATKIKYAIGDNGVNTTTTPSTGPSSRSTNSTLVNENAATSSPSSFPSFEATNAPSYRPSDVPSLKVSVNVTSGTSSNVPSAGTTDVPSGTPSNAPSVGISDVPTVKATNATSGISSEAPSNGHTSSRSPSASPSVKYSTVPSTSPSASSFPTLSPSQFSSVTPSVNSSAVPTASTAAPSSIRTNTFSPSSEPSRVPSKNSSAVPTASTAAPSSIPTNTFSPSSEPSRVPSKNLSDAPSTAISSIPTKSITAPPSPAITGRPTSALPLISSTVEALFVILEPLDPMNDDVRSYWESAHSEHVTRYFEQERDDVTDVTVKTRFVSQDPPYLTEEDMDEDGSMRRQRSLEVDDLTINFEQTVSYRIDNVSTTLLPEEFVKEPFKKLYLRNDYIDILKAKNSEAFGMVETCSNIRKLETDPPTVAPSAENGSNTLIIILSASGTIGALLIMFIGYIFWRRRRYRDDLRYDNEMSAEKNSSQVGDEASLENPAPKLGVYSSAESLVGYEDKSLATVDYDYSKAFAGDASLSSAGGTLGEFTRGTGATPNSQSRSGRQPGASLFSTEDSFTGPSDSPNTPPYQETLVHVYAPAGKLGVVIDTPNDGAPVVHAIKDSSVIADKLRVGDRLVSVDDEDVRSMTAIKVSKMISRKASNPTRKLTVIRSTLMDQ